MSQFKEIELAVNNLTDKIDLAAQKANELTIALDEVKKAKDKFKTK